MNRYRPDHLSAKTSSATPCPNPKCRSRKSNVLDSRYHQKDTLLGIPTKRRRRVCLECDRRWTTYEFNMSDIKRVMYDKGIVTAKMLRDWANKIKRTVN